MSDHDKIRAIMPWLCAILGLGPPRGVGVIIGYLDDDGDLLPPNAAMVSGFVPKPAGWKAHPRTSARTGPFSFTNLPEVIFASF